MSGTRANYVAPVVPPILSFNLVEDAAFLNGPLLYLIVAKAERPLFC